MGSMASGSPYTYLSMGFYFHCQDVALDSVGHFFRVGQEGAGPLTSLKDGKPARYPVPSSRTCRSHPKMNGIKLWTIRKLPQPWRRTLVDLHVLGSAPADLHPCDFVESRFLEEQLTFIK